MSKMPLPLALVLSLPCSEQTAFVQDTVRSNTRRSIRRIIIIQQRDEARGGEGRGGEGRRGERRGGEGRGGEGKGGEGRRRRDE